MGLDRCSKCGTKIPAGRFLCPKCDGGGEVKESVGQSWSTSKKALFVFVVLALIWEIIRLISS